MDAAIERVKAVMARLPEGDLRDLRSYLDGILLTAAEREALERATGAATRGESVASAQARGQHRLTFRREWVRCGKPSCSCAKDDRARHGPYLYKYWWERGHTRKAYVGRR